MHIKRLIKQIIAIGGVGVAAIQLYGIISSGNPTPDSVIYLFFFALIGGLGAFSLIRDEKEEAARIELGKTKKLIELIMQNHGKTTFADLIMHIEVPIPMLKAKLEELQKEGIVGMEVSNSGEIVYFVSNPKKLEDKFNTQWLN
jgi:hypothetical protein